MQVKPKLILVFAAFAGSACSAHDLRDSSGSRLTNRWLYVSGAGLEKVKDFEPSFALNSGQMSGYTGCNHFQAEFKTSGNNIKINFKLKTSMPCSSQQAVAAELAFEEFLRSVERFETDAETLKLLNAEGSSLLMRAYVPKPKASLVGTEWKMLSAAMFPGAVGTSEMIQAHRAVFDGRKMTLQQPCYTVTANYTADDASVRFSNVQVAARACKEKREADFILQYVQPLLSKTDRYTIVERRLTLFEGTQFQLDFDAN